MKCKQNATDTGNERNLTKAEQSILETMLNPENRMKSVADILECYLAEQTKLYKMQAYREGKNSLEVLINTDYLMKSITNICKATNCTRNIYYDAFSWQ